MFEIDNIGDDYTLYKQITGPATILRNSSFMAIVGTL